MLHTKFQGYLPFGTGDDLLRFLSFMGMAAILVMWPGPVEQTFISPSHGGSIWNLTLTDPVVSEEMFENVDTHTDDRGLPIRRLSGELKMPRVILCVYIGCPGRHVPGRQVDIIVIFPIMSAFNVFRHQSICYDYNQSLEIELYARKKSNMYVRGE